MINIAGQIRGELHDLIRAAISDELSDAIWDYDNSLSHPIHQHFHNTLNHPQFLNSIYSIRRKLDQDFFMRDVDGREELRKRINERLQQRKN